MSKRGATAPPKLRPAIVRLLAARPDLVGVASLATAVDESVRWSA